MPLENDLKALTAAITAMTEVLKTASFSVPVQQPQAMTVPVAAPAPAPVVEAPVAAPAFVPPAPPAAPVVAAEMPAPPTFLAAPAPAPAAPSGAPFNDSKGMMTYVMDTYKTLGAVKGQQIQGILTELGVGNINDLPAEMYGSLYTKVEALKAS